MNDELTYSDICTLQTKYNVEKFRIKCDVCGRVALYFNELDREFLCACCSEARTESVIVYFSDLQFVLDALKRSEK